MAAAASCMLGIVMDLLWFRFRFKLAVLEGGKGGGGRNWRVPEFVSLPWGWMYDQFVIAVEDCAP